MSEQIYRIWFEDPDGNRRWIDTNKGIWPATEGFWVDSDWQYTVGLDETLHWIPPGRIVLVTKLARVDDSAEGNRNE